LEPPWLPPFEPFDFEPVPVREPARLCEPVPVIDAGWVGVGVGVGVCVGVGVGVGETTTHTDAFAAIVAWSLAVACADAAVAA